MFIGCAVHGPAVCAAREAGKMLSAPLGAVLEIRGPRRARFAPGLLAADPRSGLRARVRVPSV